MLEFNLNREYPSDSFLPNIVVASNVLSELAEPYVQGEENLRRCLSRVGA